MIALFVLLGCPEYALGDQGKVYGSGDRAPAMEVDPPELVFPALAPGETATAPLTVRSVGDEPLHLFGVGLTGSGAFVVVDPPVNLSLDPDTEVTLEVVFSPANTEDRAELELTSNDPERGTVRVPLTGEGLVPELVIAPHTFDFGDVPAGCDATTTVGLYNNGLAPLTVTGLAEVGLAYSVTGPTLPAVLAPGASTEVTLGFHPTTTGAEGGELWVESDDPRGYLTATQTGTGTDAGGATDEFLQGDGPWERTDILVYVDQSCSMDDDQTNLAANFSQFVDALAAVELDWQLLVATADDGCGAGELITAGTADLDLAVLDAVRGAGGRYTEAGLTIADHALAASAGDGCNAGFLREDAKTTVILVSDEPEQSPRSWDELVPQIQASAPSAAIHSVVGDVPRGCTTAAPGTGYQEASLATGGAVLSICGADWGSYFEMIATLTASGAVASFPLSGWPDPATIEVTLDETPTSSWSYREDLNAVEFPAWAVPAPGALIRISYAFSEDCAG